MLSKEVSLNLDLRNIVFIKGDPKVINKNNKSNYVTSIVLTLPINQNRFKEGFFQIEYEGSLVNIHIFKVETIPQDPFLSLPDDLRIVISGPGIPSLPLKAFTDNKGKYPYYCAEVIFPFLLANWLDPLSPTGLKEDNNNKRIAVTGPPEDEDKIETLIVLNEFFSSLESNQKKKTIAYEDVTYFIENYFIKQNSLLIIKKVNSYITRYFQKHRYRTSFRTWQ